MAYNYKEAEEKAKMDELSLESQSKVLAATGDFKRQKRVQRELEHDEGMGGEVRQAGRPISRKPRNGRRLTFT